MQQVARLEARQQRRLHLHRRDQAAKAPIGLEHDDPVNMAVDHAAKRTRERVFLFDASQIGRHETLDRLFGRGHDAFSDLSELLLVRAHREDQPRIEEARTGDPTLSFSRISSAPTTSLADRTPTQVPTSSTTGISVMFSPARIAAVSASMLPGLTDTTLQVITPATVVWFIPSISSIGLQYSRSGRRNPAGNDFPWFLNCADALLESCLSRAGS